MRYLTFCISDDFWWLPAGFTNFLCLIWPPAISVTQLWQSCHPEVNTSKVMKQNIATSLPALQMHNCNMTVVSGSKSYPQSWCHIPTLFWEVCEISMFCTSVDLWHFLAGFHQFSLSDLISSYQCKSNITLMSSWSQYLRSYEAKHHYELPSPKKCTISTWQLCQAWRATLKVGVTCLPYFKK